MIAPTYCHGQNLLARSLSFLARKLLKQPVYRIFTSQDLTELVQVKWLRAFELRAYP